MRPALSWALFGSFALALGSGCRGCREDKPYTPFGVASAPENRDAGRGDAENDEPAAPASDGGVTAEKAVLAPPGSRRFAIGNRELGAPDGFVFERAVGGDFDDDGRLDHVAWLVPAPGAAPGARSEAWLFPEGGQATRLAATPGFVPSGPSCKEDVELARTGPHTVTADVRASCGDALIARAPSRALLVLAPAAERQELLLLRVAPAAPGETLELHATTFDRDQDGRDDVEVTVAVSSEAHGAAEAKVAWYDRAAGPSRDTREPIRSLETRAASLLAHAKTKKTAERTLAGVQATRRLLSTLCNEGATPRVFDRDGGGLACGSLARVTEQLATAEIRAELARGSVLGAFGALSRDGWYFGKLPVKAKKELEKAALEGVKPFAATVTFLPVRPRLSPPPRYSPLAFDAEGALTIVTPEGVARLSPDASEVAMLDLGAGAPRALEVASGAGQRFTGVAYSCDRSEVTLLVAGAAVPYTTKLLAPRPGACGRAPFETLPAAQPISFAPGRLALVLGGAEFGEPSGPPWPEGSARSPNGRFLAVPTSFGLLVTGDEATRLFELGSAAPAPLRLTDCVPANDGRRAACVIDGRVLVARTSG